MSKTKADDSGWVERTVAYFKGPKPYAVAVIVALIVTLGGILLERKRQESLHASQIRQAYIARLENLNEELQIDYRSFAEVVFLKTDVQVAVLKEGLMANLQRQSSTLNDIQNSLERDEQRELHRVYQESVGDMYRLINSLDGQRSEIPDHAHAYDKLVQTKGTFIASIQPS